MSVSVAIASLRGDLPGWLEAQISAPDARRIEAATAVRRHHELRCSRGLLGGLMARLGHVELRHGDSGYGDSRPKDSMHADFVPVDSSQRESTARFSITHDRRWTAVAVASHGRIGIDLQTTRGLECGHRIAANWFCAPEAAEILRAESSRFLLSWVLKEAWAKCMRRSIFHASRRVAVWQNQVHLTSGESDDLQFAWLRSADLADLHAPAGAESGLAHAAAAKTEFAIGICVRRKTPDTPPIECMIPTRDRWQPCAAPWQWIPLAH